MEEIWKPVRELPDDYEISSEGRLRRTSATRGSHIGRVRKPTLRSGYPNYVFKKDGVVIARWGHRLVADAFLGPIPPGMQVNHKNGVRHDNRLVNLEIVTSAENRAHAYRVLGIPPNRAVGARNTNVKLDWESVDDIRRATADGSSSYSQLARKYGVSKPTIAAVCYGWTWKETDRPI